jgi:hypothetical protein
MRRIRERARIEDDVHLRQAPPDFSAAGAEDRIGQGVAHHAIDSVRAQQADAVELSLVQVHLAEPQVNGPPWTLDCSDPGSVLPSLTGCTECRQSPLSTLERKHNSTLRQWMMPLRPGAVLGFVFSLLLK